MEQHSEELGGAGGCGVEVNMNFGKLADETGLILRFERFNKKKNKTKTQ